MIWACMTGAVVFYGLIPTFFLSELGAPDPGQTENLSLLVPILSALGLAEAGAVIFMSRYSCSEAGLLKLLSRSQPSATESTQSFSSDERQLISVAERLSMRAIIGVAICDSIAVYGLVLSIMSRAPEYAYIGAAVGLLVAFAIKPNIIEGVEQATLLQAKARV